MAYGYGCALAETSTDPFSFPLCLRTSTKLRLKYPQWTTAIELIDSRTGAHREGRGCDGYSGLKPAQRDRSRARP